MRLLVRMALAVGRLLASTDRGTQLRFFDGEAEARSWLAGLSDRGSIV